ncbi:MAG: M12 family metallo-peptidase, partial [Planctomycetota bacterium]|nr:M12 family metallo-peptidase [Planctomycetota bacterium]
ESVAAASPLFDGWVGAVRLTRAETWFVAPLSRAIPGATRGQHLVYRPLISVLERYECGTDLLPPAPDSGAEREDLTAESGLNNCFTIAELAFDCDYDCYLLNGSSVPNTVADIDAVLNTMNVIYARDVQIEHLLTATIVRAVEPDPYTSYDPGTILGEFVNEWNANQGAISRGAAHLAVGKEMDGNIIGLAYVGVYCNLNWAYGLTQWNLSFDGRVGVLAHELGHNWNAPHCLDPSCVVMCGACHQFGPITSGVIMDYRDAVGCLTSSSGFGQPVPPHAFPDEARVPAGAAPLRLDVLANDIDGNCETVVIDAFDAVSANGGGIVLSPGTGPGGRDELDYTPAAGLGGIDTFTYTAGDGSGLQDTTVVTLLVEDGAADLVAHFKLDEAPGTFNLIDASGNGNNGTFYGGVMLGNVGAAAGTNTSVYFDGVDGRGRWTGSTALNRVRNNLTVAAWIQPRNTDGIQRIIANSGAWGFGLSGSDLLYTTFGIQDYTATTGIATDVWVHVAVVCDFNDDVSFYKNGIRIGSASGTAEAGAPATAWFLGTLDNGGEFFSGSIDDIQIYDAALSADQVRYLFDHPGELASPCDGGQAYCTPNPSSLGVSAHMDTLGTPLISLNDLVLLASPCPAMQPGVFFYGPGTASLPLGDGLLCVGGSIVRCAPVFSDVFGLASKALDFTGGPQVGGGITTGSTWNFQYWYRDPAAVGGGGAGYNLSDAWSMTFCD